MLRPMNGYILIEPIEEDTTENGLTIIRQHQTSDRNTGKGKVLKTSKEYVLAGTKVKQPSELKEGDIIIYFKPAEVKIKEKDKEYILVREIDINGVIE